VQVRPDLRFAPRALHTAALATKDPERRRGYRVPWCPAGGACVDARPPDATRVSTPDAPSGLLVRRVKHFCGDTGVANRAAWQRLARFDKPLLCAFTDGDPITAGADRPLRDVVPGARGQAHVTIRGGGHFVQEDRGEELARVVTDFVLATPTEAP